MSQRIVLPSRIITPPPVLARGLRHTAQTRLAIEHAREDYRLESFIESLRILEGGG